MSDKLTMKFHPRTIEHLGVKMYSQIPAAIAELVANAYDADATEVKINLYDKQDKRIVVEDNGCGMAFGELNEKFLQIGRNRREDGDTKTALGRFPSGKKGLGKLALFGLGDTVIVKTKKERNAPQSFSMKWSDIKESSGDYEPALTDDKLTIDHGTQVTVSDLKRKSSFNQEEIVNSLSKLFVCFDNNFQVSVSVNDREPELLNNESKFKDLDIQFEWKDFSKCPYASNKGITGKIVTTNKPLKPGMRGITLYASGRLVNLPEFYGNIDSSHFYAYTTGIFNVDFIDEYSGDDDLISTNRQALNWEHEVTIELKRFLQELIIDIQRGWREKRKISAKLSAKPTTNFDYQKWISTLPEDTAEAINTLLDSKMEDNDSASRKNITEALYKIAPEYAEFHWRYLHSKLKESADVRNFYEQSEYFSACEEAIKIYVSECKDKSGIHNVFEHKLIEECFSCGKDSDKAPMINLISHDPKHPKIYENIQNGHAHLSQGVLAAYRNVLSHNPRDIVKQFVSPDDCLDILSLISYLLRKLEQGTVRVPNA